MKLNTGIIKKGAILVLLLVVLTGTATACTKDEFESRMNQTEDATETTPAGVAELTPDSPSCEEEAYNEWVSEYGYVADRGPDGQIRAIPDPDGFGAFLMNIEACS